MSGRKRYDGKKRGPAVVWGNIPRAGASQGRGSFNPDEKKKMLHAKKERMFSGEEGNPTKGGGYKLKCPDLEKQKSGAEQFESERFFGEKGDKGGGEKRIA